MFLTNKISFVASESESFPSLTALLSATDAEIAREMIFQYLSMDAPLSFAFAVTDGTLVVRVFDGSEYSFVFPQAISLGCDVRSAIQKCVTYAVLEEITPVFLEVPSEFVGVFFELGYRHVNADADSPDSETYRVTLNNECALVDEYPDCSVDEIELSQLKDEDKEPYGRLCRDAENNKYWGYDYREDYREASDELFLGLAEKDFLSDSALSFAIRFKDEFVGEALISSFDYKGGADVSVRILPEHQNKGCATKALELLFEIGAEIGLITLYARVYTENLPSVSLFSKFADEKAEENEVVVFTYNLY